MPVPRRHKLRFSGEFQTPAHFPAQDDLGGRGEVKVGLDSQRQMSLSPRSPELITELVWKTGPSSSEYCECSTRVSTVMPGEGRIGGRAGSCYFVWGSCQRVRPLWETVRTKLCNGDSMACQALQETRINFRTPSQS